MLDALTLPISLELHNEMLPLYSEGLGYYFDSSRFFAREPLYRKKVVFYDRFCHDMISLFGTNLLSIKVTEFEGILRTFFHTLTTTVNGRIRFKPLEDIQTPFSNQKKEDRRVIPKKVVVETEVPTMRPLKQLFRLETML